MLQRAELLPPQASKRCAFESPVSAWWRHGGRMLIKLFDAPRFSRVAGPRTAPRRAGSLRKNHFLPVRGWPPPEPTLENFQTSRCGVFSQESGIPGIRKSRPRLRPARLSGSARGGFPAAGAVSGTLRREIQFRAFQKLGHRCGENAPGERESGPVPLIVQNPAISTSFVFSGQREWKDR